MFWQCWGSLPGQWEDDDCASDQVAEPGIRNNSGGDLPRHFLTHCNTRCSLVFDREQLGSRGTFQARVAKLPLVRRRRHLTTPKIHGTLRRGGRPSPQYFFAFEVCDLDCSLLRWIKSRIVATRRVALYHGKAVKNVHPGRGFATVSMLGSVAQRTGFVHKRSCQG